MQCAMCRQSLPRILSAWHRRVSLQQQHRVSSGWDGAAEIRWFSSAIPQVEGSAPDLHREILLVGRRVIEHLFLRFLYAAENHWLALSCKRVAMGHGHPGQRRFCCFGAHRRIRDWISFTGIKGHRDIYANKKIHRGTIEVDVRLAEARGPAPDSHYCHGRLQFRG
jgi:hypothetical protein